MAYRDDVDALQARHDALAADVAKRTRERDEAALLLAEARARAEEEERLRAQLANEPRRRRRNKRIAIASGAAAVALAAVIGFVAARHHDRRARMEANFAELTDRVCECKDMQCVNKLFELAAREFGDKGDAHEPDERELELAKRLGECVSRLSASVPNGGLFD